MTANAMAPAEQGADHNADHICVRVLRSSQKWMNQRMNNTKTCLVSFYAHHICVRVLRSSQKWNKPKKDQY